MDIKIITLDKALSNELKAYQIKKPENYKLFFNDYAKKIIIANLSNESEEHIKNNFKDLITSLYSYNANTYYNIDLVITDDGDLRVLIEAKRPVNTTEMVSDINFNTKAFHEALFYFYKLTDTQKIYVNTILITNGKLVYSFSSKIFKELLNNKNIKTCLNGFTNKTLEQIKTTNDLYNSLKPCLNSIDLTIETLKIDLTDVNENNIDLVFKALSPYYLWKKNLSNDANSLNIPFYNELLHILGLRETDDKPPKLVKSSLKNSMIDLTMQMINEYKNDFKECYTITQTYELALSLNILWINRILFLKLLESHLRMTRNDEDFAILNQEFVPRFQNLAHLFFKILNTAHSDREYDDQHHKMYKLVPYLNSSLFTKADEEKYGVFNLFDGRQVEVLSSTIIKNAPKKLNTLDYLLQFLNCYQFNRSHEGFDEHTVIKSSVLGLIFEKLNGHKDGAHFTPASITMHMSKELLRKLLVKKMNKAFNIKLEDYNALQNYAKENFYNEVPRKKACDVLDSLTIIDPSVGSGHFLVSVMNELIAIRADLTLFPNNIQFYVSIINDELHIRRKSNDEYFIYKQENNEISEERRNIQQYIFNLKRNIIQNQLYGVDINHDSVNICRLRLWIELLKSSYFKDDAYLELEVLPNLEFKVIAANSLNSLDVKDIELFFQKDVLRNTMMMYYNSSKEKRPDIIEKVQNELKILKSHLNNTKKHKYKLDDYDPFKNTMTKAYKFFDSILMFGITKFDMVIGNPPYGIKLTETEKKTYKNRWPIGSTNTAALFTMLMFDLLNKDGVGGFIIPKSFTYSSKWKETRQKIIEPIYHLTDCGKAWQDVKLEMAIFLIENNESHSYFENYILENQKQFRKLENVSKTDCLEFGIFINNITKSQLELGKKIKANNKMLNTFAINHRGATLQKLVTNTVEKYKVIGGAGISRYYYTNEIKGYIPESVYKVNSSIIIKNNSILVQNIISHVEKPYPHIKFIGILGSQVSPNTVIIDTINQLENISQYSSSYLLALIHSKLVNYYAYLFVLSRAIRTMHFDEPTCKALPIAEPSGSQEIEINNLVSQILMLKDNDLPTKHIEEKIDMLVYQIYNLTSEEIEMIENGL